MNDKNYNSEEDRQDAEMLKMINQFKADHESKKGKPVKPNQPMKKTMFTEHEVNGLLDKILELTTERNHWSGLAIFMMNKGKVDPEDPEFMSLFMKCFPLQENEKSIVENLS